jgi:hypothetical protein
MFRLGIFFDRLFGALCGFNSKSMRKLNFRDQLKIKFLSIWGLIGTLICAFSSAYLTFHATNVIWLAVLFFIFVAFLLIALQILLVTSSGMDLTIKPMDRKKWRPSIFRFITVLIIGIIFSQPVVFTTMALNNFLNSNASIQNLNVQEQAIINKYKNNIKENNLQITKVQTLRNLIDENAPNVIPRYVKKALIIDDGKTVGPINNTVNILKGLGFQTTHVSKVYGANLEFKIKDYFEHLDSGDISLVIYRGNAKVSLSQTLMLVNSDLKSTEDGVEVDNIITIIKNRKPLNSYFLFSIPSIELNSISLDLIKWPKQGNAFSAFLINDNANETLLDIFTSKLLTSKEMNTALANTIASAKENITDSQKLQYYQPTTLPFFLSWSEGLFYEKYDKESLKKILPKNESCNIYTEFDQKLVARCLTSEESISNSQIRFMNEMMITDVENIESLKKQKILKPSIIFNYFGAIWEHKFSTFIFTILAIFSISGGIIIRDFFTSAIVSYESENNKLSRVTVHLAFKQYRQKLRDLRKAMMLEGEFFDNDTIQHPLYRIPIPKKITKNDIKNDEFYNLLSSQINSKYKS